MLTTQQLGSTLDMPVCTYSIRKDKIDGDLLRYAKIGDQTVHRWDCPGGIDCIDEVEHNTELNDI